MQGFTNVDLTQTFKTPKFSGVLALHMVRVLADIQQHVIGCHGSRFSEDKKDNWVILHHLQVARDILVKGGQVAQTTPRSWIT